MHDLTDVQYNKSTELMLLDFNNDLHELLKQHKNHISNHFWTKKWDKYKKYANEYELIFTSGYGYPSLSKYAPISRSYFKLWEILVDYKHMLDMDSTTPKTCAFLAEGPGGFIEAYCNFRALSCKNKVKDDIFGVTLLSQDRNIPSWRLSSRLVNEFDIKLLKGADNTGSLYNIDNIQDYVNVIGKHTCDIVTADGGFDFSNDFNNQEEQSTKLIIAETLTCLHLQKPGGVFILKLYDIHSLITIQILFIMKEMYQNITFIKPLSSRPANSEKYMFCYNFKGYDSPMYKKYVDILTDIIRTQSQTMMHLQDIHVPNVFLNDIIEYNAYYIIKQIIQINKTLCFIDLFQNEKDDVRFLSNLRMQLRKAIKWCNKYKIPISIQALQCYSQNLSHQHGA